MSAVYCPKCSTAPAENAQFCSVCGTFLSFQSEHPTLLIEAADQEAINTGATVLAERAERAEDASIPSMVTERGAPQGVMGRQGLAGNPTYATAPGALHENDDTPTMPGVLAQFEQATELPAVHSSRPELVYRERRQAEVAKTPAMQLFLPQQADPVPIQYPRHGAVASRKHQKGFLSRYFLFGTGFLLFIGIIALFTYPSFIKGNVSAMTATTAALARPAVVQIPTSHAVATSVPVPTPAATQQATTYSAASSMSTPTAVPAPPAQCLHVSKPALNFSTTSGGNAPAPQTIMLSNACTTGAWSIRWDTPWLSASPVYNSTVNGVTPVVINVASANLAANSYTGHIVFISGASKATVTVNLTVAQPATTTTTAATSCIKLDQHSLSFSAPPQQNPAPQVIMVTNCGSDGTVAANVSTSYISRSLPSAQSNQPPHSYGTNWLTTSPGGQLAAGNTLPIHVNVTALGPGVYTSSIAITITTSDGKIDTHIVNVTFTVQGS